MKKLFHITLIGLFFSAGAVADNKIHTQYARAKIYLTSGKYAGKAFFLNTAKGVIVNINVGGLTPGFHGFHIHAKGLCDNATTPAFTSAGPHFKLIADSNHRDHNGDLPVLFVNNDGTAKLSFQTDRFQLADLFDADGSAMIIHANPDNYANIPTDRYVLSPSVSVGSTFPDASTLATGDAGARVACGIINKF